jgi:spore germination protein YaaH
VCYLNADEMFNRKKLSEKNYIKPFLAVLLLLLVYGFLGYPEKLSRKFFAAKKSTAAVVKKRVHKRSLHFRTPIRAAFYNPTDSIAYRSLQANISKVNMLIIDNLFINPNTDSVCIKPGFLGRTLIQKSGITSLALLSNFYGDNFNGAALHRILSDSVKTAGLVDQIIKTLQSNHFSGVNIDFEELQESSNKPLLNFEKILYHRMHPLGLMVTIDVIPFNSDYNTTELAKYNDEIFLMAYDQYSDTSAPGPVSSLSWIKSILTQETKKLPASKYVLCIAGYGYDWPEYGNGQSVSYSEAIRIAAKNAANIVLNDTTFNPYFTYTDASRIIHQVYFTSAKTNVAAIHLAHRAGVAGVALWRLGTEDKRLWSYYDQQVQPAPPFIITDGEFNLNLNSGAKDYNYQTVGVATGDDF